jgi:indolepyruvate decarboxylase
MLGVEMTDMSMGFLPRNVWRKNAILSTCTEMSVRSHSFKKVRFLDFFNKLSVSTFTRCKWLDVGEKEVKKYISDPSKKLTSHRLFEKVNSIITDQMAIIADVGDAMFGGSGISVNRNHFLSPAFYNSMGFAIPGCLGAHCANTNLRCLVLVGDGSFQMTSNELSTIIRRGFNPIIVVLNNGGFMTERFFKDGPYNDIGNWNYHNMGMVLGGGIGEQVTTEGELDLAFAKALASKQVFIINAMLDKTDASPALKKVIGGTLAAKMNNK